MKPEARLFIQDGKGEIHIVEGFSDITVTQVLNGIGTASVSFANPQDKFWGWAKRQRDKVQYLKELLDLDLRKTYLREVNKDRRVEDISLERRCFYRQLREQPEAVYSWYNSMGKIEIRNQAYNSLAYGEDMVRWDPLYPFEMMNRVWIDFKIHPMVAKKLGLSEDTWFAGFTGLISSVSDSYSKGKNVELVLSCKDLLRLFQLSQFVLQAPYKLLDDTRTIRYFLDKVTPKDPSVYVLSNYFAGHSAVSIIEQIISTINATFTKDGFEYAKTRALAEAAELERQGQVCSWKDSFFALDEKTKWHFIEKFWDDEVKYEETPQEGREKREKESIVAGLRAGYLFALRSSGIDCTRNISLDDSMSELPEYYKRALKKPRKFYVDYSILDNISIYQKMIEMMQLFAYQVVSGFKLLSDIQAITFDEFYCAPTGDIVLQPSRRNNLPGVIVRENFRDEGFGCNRGAMGIFEHMERGTETLAKRGKRLKIKPVEIDGSLERKGLGTQSVDYKEVVQDAVKEEKDKGLFRKKPSFSLREKLSDFSWQFLRMAERRKERNIEEFVPEVLFPEKYLFEPQDYHGPNYIIADDTLVSWNFVEAEEEIYTNIVCRFGVHFLRAMDPLLTPLALEGRAVSERYPQNRFGPRMFNASESRIVDIEMLFGGLSEELKEEFLNRSDFKNAFAEALLHRLNMGVKQGEVSLVGRADLGVGKTVYLVERELLGYINQVVLSYREGSDFSTKLSLTEVHDLFEFVPNPWYRVWGVMEAVLKDRYRSSLLKDRYRSSFVSEKVGKKVKKVKPKVLAGFDKVWDYMEKEEKRDISLKGNLKWPVIGRITSGFGVRNRELHRGIDIAAPAGTPVECAADGIVVGVNWKTELNGNCISVYHGTTARVFTFYLHLLLPPNFSRGDRVKAGQVLGRVGNTGKSFGNHLHFAVTVKGKYVDPLEWLEERSVGVVKK